jgi:hypothetical protein
VNSYLTHLVATQRIADLTRSAEEARRQQQEPSTRPARRSARTVIRLRLRGAGSGRLRVRRA